MSFTNNNDNGIGPEVEIVATDTNFDLPTSFNGEDADGLQHVVGTELPFGDGAEEGHTTTTNKKAASYYKIALGVFSLSAVLLFFAAGTSVAVVRNNNAVIAPLPLTDCISKAPSTSKASKAPSSMPSVSVYPTVPLAAFSKPSVSGSPTVSLAPTVAPTAKASKAPSTPVSYSLSAKASKAPKAPKCSKSLKSLSLSV